MDDIMLLKGKKILILGGVVLMREIVQCARSMGVIVYVTDFYETSPAKEIADKSFMVSTTDVDAVVNLIKREKIDGVLTGFVDMLLPYYQEICEKTGLPCYATKEQIEIMTDKNRIKDLCKKYGVPVVEEYSLSNKSDIKYPVIIKPVDNSGGRGIVICMDQVDFDKSCEYALSFSPSKQVIIERYMENMDEVSIFYVAIAGKIFLMAMGNRFLDNSQDGVIPLPVAYLFPFTYLQKYKSDLNDRVIAMFKSIGIKDGMLFIQSFVENEECVFYEMGYRLTGSLEYKLTNFANGFNTMEMMIRFALTGKMLDREIAPSPEFIAPSCNLTFSVRPGVIASIEGIEEIKMIPGVLDLFLSKKEGNVVLETAKGTLDQVILRVFASRETKTELKETIDRVHQVFKVCDENGDNMLLPVFNTDKLSYC